MIYSIFPQKDTTIYEDSRLQNTGLDAILEITKSIVDSDPLNSRILIKFDTDDIPSEATSSAEYYLNLYATEAWELPLEYILYVKAISGSWNMGIGKRSNFPIVDDGASWAYRDDNTSTGSWFESTAESASYNYSTYSGGGSWYTSSICSQSYDYETVDLRANVTDIVEDWLNDIYENEGFIVKRTGSIEEDSTGYGAIKFFSKETHTIFIPKLEVCWDDSSFETGSLSALLDSDTEISDIIVYPKNMKREYNENVKTKIRLVGRERFPTRTYVTSSFYSTVKYLPSASFYSVKDIASEEVIVPFNDDYTKISCDSESNYFNFWCSGLQPNRFYKFIFKIIDVSNNQMFFDDNYIFKIIK